jgi:hypothetical protein
VQPLADIAEVKKSNGSFPIGERALATGSGRAPPLAEMATINPQTIFAVTNLPNGGVICFEVARGV